MAISAADNIIQRLNVSDPEMNTSVGTPIRKIIDAVSSEINDMFVDTYLLQTSYDVSQYSGKDLDDLCSLFGFSRQTGKSAYGTVTVTRDNSDASMSIVSGTQFSTSGSNRLFFSSVTDVYMSAGQPSARVPVISALPGAMNNVASGTIDTMVNKMFGAKVSNPLSFTGGKDAETDEVFRARFKNTVFRGVAGTREQYLGIASTYDAVSAYRLFGSKNTTTEYLTIADIGGEFTTQTQARDIRDVQKITPLGNTPSSVWVRAHETGEVLARFSDFTTAWVEGSPNAIKLVFPEKVVASERFVCNKSSSIFLEHDNININSLVIKTDDNTVVTNLFTLEGGELTRSADDNPAVLFTASYAFSSVKPGDIVIVTYDYESTKCDPTHGATLYIDGAKETAATDSRYIDFAGVERINDTNKVGWIRQKSGEMPKNNNAILVLSNSPVIDIADSISFAGVGSMVENVDYWLIKDVTVNSGSTHALDAIEINMTEAPIKVTTSTKVPVNIEYSYNATIPSMQLSIDDVTPIATKCLVKEAKRRYFHFHLDVISQTHTREKMVALANEKLASFMSFFQIGEPIQVSDILREVSSITGVDSCRLFFTQAEDVITGGIQEFSASGYSLGEYATDIILDTDELASFKGASVNLLTQEVWNVS